MSLEQDILDLTQNIDDLNGSLRALNGTLIRDLQKMGTDVQKTAKAASNSAKGLSELQKAAREAAATTVDAAKREARRQMDKEKYHKTWMGRMEQQAGTSIENHKALMRMTDRVNMAGQVLGTLGKTAMSLGKSLFEGKEGASANNEAIGALTGGLGSLLDSFGIFGRMLGGVIRLFGNWLQETNKMSDRMYRSYQELSKVGITAADGMFGVAEAAQRLGFSLDDAGMGEFAKLMKGASQDLALMSGSAIQGRKDFVDFASTVVRGQAGRELMNLGYSAAELNEGLTAYMGLQSRVGMTQNRSINELAKGAAAYLREMDGLTKLTGIQRQELEDGINKARAVEAFRAKVEDLRAKGQVKEAEQMELYYAVLLKQAPKLAQGFAESAAGFIVSPEGRQYFQAIDAGTGVVQGLSTGAMDATRALSATYKQAKLSEEQFRGLAMAMASGDVIGSYTELADIAKRSGIDMEEASRIIREVQTAQAQGPGGVAAQTDMRRAQMDSRAALQQLAVTTSQYTTPAMSGLASVTRTIIQGLGGKVPAPGPAATGAAPAAAPAAPGAGAAAGPGVGHYMGDLRLKSREAVAGGAASPTLMALAKQIQDTVGGNLLYFSAFNDTYERGPNSKHRLGQAMDFVLKDPSTSRSVASTVAGLLGGRGKVIDEYLNPSRSATGGHIHVELGGFATGGIASGPKSGYNALLHGTEAVVPLPDGRTIPVEMPNLDRSMEQQVGMLSAQLMALQDLVRVMRDNNSISTKILQATNN